MYDYFGLAVAISRETIVVGAPGTDVLTFEDGSVYVFVKDGAGWIEQQKILHPDPSLAARFGGAISISGDTLLVGSFADDGFATPGSAYVFERNGSSFGLDQELSASHAAVGDAFGASVSVSGETAVVGAWGAEDGGAGALNTGTTYVFVRGDTGWKQLQRLAAADAAEHDYYGTSVAISGETFLIGVTGDDDAGEMSGSAHALRIGLATKTVCSGDGSDGPCPCGNEAMAGQGCRHSGAVGMTIAAAGSVSIDADNLTLTAAQCPPGNTGVFFTGAILDVTPGPSFDGLFCIVGHAQRFRGLDQTNGTASDTGFAAQALPGYFAPGSTYYFQYWSRDVRQPSPCGTGANLSPALGVTMIL